MNYDKIIIKALFLKHSQSLIPYYSNRENFITNIILDVKQTKKHNTLSQIMSKNKSLKCVSI